MINWKHCPHCGALVMIAEVVNPQCFRCGHFADKPRSLCQCRQCLVDRAKGIVYRDVVDRGQAERGES